MSFVVVRSDGFYLCRWGGTESSTWISTSKLAARYEDGDRELELIRQAIADGLEARIVEAA